MLLNRLSIHNGSVVLCVVSPAHVCRSTGSKQQFLVLKYWSCGESPFIEVVKEMKIYVICKET